MAKTKRLIELILTVNAKRKFTVRELAEEFEVSKRTILRDLQDLSELGIPLYSEVGPHGGYRVLKNRMLPPIAFTENEAIALFFASQSLELYSSLPFEAESASALKKFYHFLPEETRNQIDRMKTRVLFWTPTRNQQSPYLRQLLEAAMNSNLLTIEYDSSSGFTKRDILPLGLYASRGFWYCPSYCYLRKEIRLFRADRIVRLSLTEGAVPEASIENKTIHDLIKEQPELEKTTYVTIKLSKMGVRRFQTEMPDENEITVHEDGTSTVRIIIDQHDLDFFVDLFYGFGTDAKVLSPPEMIKRIRKRIEAVRKHYEA